MALNHSWDYCHGFPFEFSYEIKTSVRAGGAPDQNLLAEAATLRAPSANTSPDVYYIVLDSYTRNDTLSAHFSFDNSGFIESLESAGFYVADCSQSNYSYTTLSLASSLNFNYLQALSPSLSSESKDETDVYPLLFHNAAAYFFRQMGYRFVAFESGFSPTELVDADVYYSQGVLVGHPARADQPLRSHAARTMSVCSFMN
jgi:hypothetical protein